MRYVHLLQDLRRCYGAGIFVIADCGERKYNLLVSPLKKVEIGEWWS